MAPKSISCLLPGLILIATLLTGCKDHTEPSGKNTANANHLGELHLQVSGAPEAQPHFKQGLLLLHSFEYDDAREAFRKARETDPGFAMAYWGEAMTYNHPLWREQAYAEARQVLDTLAPTAEERMAKAGTELERDFLRAVDVLYGEGDKTERDKAYADFMTTLYKKYPGNHEVAAFCALSQLGAVAVGQDMERYEEGARIAKEIIKENPDHPGAVHYLIHAYDNPANAYRAQEAANKYAVLAPDAAHALHMPSHIYVALGYWKEVVASNIDSWQASVDRMKRKNLDLDAQSYHAFHWLLYGYLQLGQRDSALAILQDMATYTRQLPSRPARSYMIHMLGNYLVETDGWDSEMAGYQVDKLNDLNLTSRAIVRFIEGMKAFKKNDLEGLQEAIAILSKDREKTKLLIGDKGVPMCSSAGANRSAPNQLDVDQAQIMEWELRALEAWSRKDPKSTENWLRRAVELQDNISYDSGPPTIVLPAFELYGEWLLEEGRGEDAKKQFGKALKWGPGRAKALKGMERATQKAI